MKQDVNLNLKNQDKMLIIANLTYPGSKHMHFPQSADAMNRQWKARLIYFSAVRHVS